MRRRDFLAAVAAFGGASLARRAWADPVDGALGHPVDPPPALRFQILEFEHTAMYGGPSTAIAGIPKDLPAGAKAPLVVLLPGGHHNMQGHVTGVWGWWCEYMLGDIDTALRRGTLAERDFYGMVRPDELAQYNALLARTPYRGAVYVTPWVVGRQLNPGPHGTMVASFLRQLVERAHAELPVTTSRETNGVGGMSSGGLWAIYSGSLCSDLFGTVVATQPFTEDLVPYLREIVHRRTQEQRLRLVTSVDDHQRKTTLQLCDALAADGIPFEMHEYLGAHSAQFAAGPGGVDALFVFDRALRGENLDGTRPVPLRDGLEQSLDEPAAATRAPYEPAPFVRDRSHDDRIAAIAAVGAGVATVGLTLAGRGAASSKEESPRSTVSPPARSTATREPAFEVEIQVEEPSSE